MGRWTEGCCPLPCKGHVHILPLCNWQTLLLTSKLNAYLLNSVRASKTLSLTGDPNGLKWKLFLFPVLSFLLLWGSFYGNPVGGKEPHLPLCHLHPRSIHCYSELFLYTHLLFWSEAESRTPATVGHSSGDSGGRQPCGLPGKAMSRIPELRWGIWVSASLVLLWARGCSLCPGLHLTDPVVDDRYGNLRSLCLWSPFILTLPSCTTMIILGHFRKENIRLWLLNTKFTH